jgi:hypothetical protein
MAENLLSAPKAAEFLLLFSYETTIHKNVKALQVKIENEKDLKKTQFLIKLHSNNNEYYLQNHGKITIADSILDSIKSSTLLVCFVTHAFCRESDCVKLIEYAARTRKKILYLILDTFENEQEMNEMSILVQNSTYVLHVSSYSASASSLCNDKKNYEAIKSAIELILNVK